MQRSTVRSVPVLQCQQHLPSVTMQQDYSAKPQAPARVVLALFSFFFLSTHGSTPATPATPATVPSWDGILYFYVQDAAAPAVRDP